MFNRSRNKYRAVRTNGFASKLEAEVYYLLSMKERSGEISNLRCQHAVTLVDGDKDQKIKTKVDFSFEKNGELRFAEAKGREDQRWKIIKKLWVSFGPAPCDVWTGNYRSPFLAYTIEPKGKASA